MTIVPPYEKDGLRFETTGYVVSIYLPEIRSYVSLSPVYNLEVSLAMEHFLNNTQGQCGGWWIERDGPRVRLTAYCIIILSVCVVCVKWIANI